MVFPLAIFFSHGEVSTLMERPKRLTSRTGEIRTHDVDWLPVMDFLTTMAFATLFKHKGLWSGALLHHIFRFRCEVYALYTFCLARRCHNALTIIKSSPS